MVEAVEVTQEDIQLAEEWGFIECRHCSEYEGDFVADLAADFARHRIASVAAARPLIMAEAAGLQPCTAENPNESEYERGRFDGIIEFGRAIRHAATPADPQEGGE